MLENKKTNIIGIILLLFATLAWGTSFVFLKQTIETVPAFYVISLRFLTAGAVLAIVFIKRIIKIDKGTFLGGVVLGLILAGAYLTQTSGLKYTTPSQNAFLTSSYCVLCPFLVWLLFRKKPKIYNVFAAVLCITGIGLIAFAGKNETGSNLILGDGLTLMGAIFFALQIIFIDYFQGKGKDPLKMLVFELLTVGVVCAISSLIIELPKVGISGYKLNMEQLSKIGYLTLVCTLMTQFAQIIGQKFVKPNQSAIILSLEAVFGAIFSVIMGAETLSFGLILGFVAVFGAVLISELKPDIKKIFSKSKSDNKGDDAILENSGDAISKSE